MLFHRSLILLLSLSILSCGSQDTNKPPVENGNIVAPSFRGQLPSIGKQAVISEIKTQYSAWKNKYLVSRPNVNTDQKFVWYTVDARFEEWTENKQAVTVSEAHGYGMLILANMASIDPTYDPNVKANFDAMVRYLNAFPSAIDSRLMSWMQWSDGIDEQTGLGNITEVIDVTDGDSAIDGDMDMAYALLIADELWGSKGTVDYREKATQIMHGILESTVHPTEHVLLLGDWVDPNSDTYGKATRASDFMLQHLRVFSNKDSKNQKKWLEVLNKTARIYVNNVNSFASSTGLIADFLVLNSDSNRYEPSPAKFLESEYDGEYYYNSSRVPWRLSMDYLYSQDNRLYGGLEVLNQWIEKASKGDPKQIYPGYYLSGATIETGWTDMAFSAPFVVSAAINPKNQQWIDGLWSHLSASNKPVSEGAYFGNSIRLVSLISAGGLWAVPHE